MGLFRRKVRSPVVVPQVGEYFMANGQFTFIYGKCEDTHPSYLQRGVIMAHCFSSMAPYGERGSFPLERIRRIITETEFEQARTSGWD